MKLYGSFLTCFVLKVPELECPVMTARDHLHVVLQELGCHHTVSVACQRVLSQQNR